MSGTSAQPISDVHPQTFIIMLITPGVKIGGRKQTH